MSNEQEFNVDRDWSANVNLSGLNAPTGQTNVEVPEGYYKALITDMYVNPDKNRNRVIIKMTISEGPFKGVVRTDGLNIPKSDDDKVRYYWRGLAESTGYTPTQLDAGAIQIGRDSFVDRTAHIRFTPKSKSADGYERVSYLPPTEWAQQEKIFSASPVETTTESAGSGDGSTKGDILGKLGYQGASA